MPVTDAKPIVEKVLAGENVVLTAESRNSEEMDRFKSSLQLFDPELKSEFVIRMKPKNFSEMEVTLILVESTNWMRSSLERALTQTSLTIKLKSDELP